MPAGRAGCLVEGQQPPRKLGAVAGAAVAVGLAAGLASEARGGGGPGVMMCGRGAGLGVVELEDELLLRGPAAVLPRRGKTRVRVAA